MKEVDGRMVATPAYEHIVTEVGQMKPGVLYPTTAIGDIPLPRGRRLADALLHDPLAPEPAMEIRAPGRMKCYTREQICAYLESYGDEFAAVQSEVAARLRIEAERIERERSAAVAKSQDECRSGIEAAQKEYAAKLDAFCSAFLAEYARSLGNITGDICGIYFLKREGRIVYIGQSVNVYARVAQHRTSKDFDEVYFLPCAEANLNDMEGFFIRLIRPELNGWDGRKDFSAPKSAIWGQVVSLPWR